MAVAQARLKRRAEFLRTAQKGRKVAMPGLVLQALMRDNAGPARLGFTVTKKVGNAVVRNRTRRRLREAARLLLREQPAVGVDLVLIGRDVDAEPALFAADRGFASSPWHGWACRRMGRTRCSREHRRPHTGPSCARLPAGG